MIHMEAALWLPRVALCVFVCVGLGRWVVMQQDFLLLLFSCS